MFRFHKDRRLLIALFAYFFFGGESSGFAQESVEPQPSKRPNIIVLLCDDLGYGDLGCYDHPHIKTPNLDALAEGGIRLTDCYSAAPVCSPSRVGLLTGRSPNRAGIYDWIPESDGTPRNNAREQVHMRSSETTIPELLQEAGYQTCMSGKWHCNSQFNSDSQPQPGDFGFDHWLATQNNARPSHKNPFNFVRNGEPVGKIESFSCQFVVTEALDWLSSKADSKKPFFLYIPFHEPHEPVESPAELVDQYRPTARNEDEAQFFANVTNVDLAVGRLVQGLKELEQLDNTLIVFTSDNGPETLNRNPTNNRSYGRTGPLRGMKLHTTDGGFRVVGIMHWPAKIKPGQVLSQTVSSLDFLPTFCSLAKAELPDELDLDGTDISPLFAEADFQREKPLIWAYYQALNKRRVAMRDGKWKVLASLNDGKLKRVSNLFDGNQADIASAKLTEFEIYDVENDVAEANDLSQEGEFADELKAKLTREYQKLIEDSHIWQRSADR